MNSHGITKENLMGALPLALRGDPSVAALAEALATVLADRLPEIDRLRIYPAIDTLDEPLLDILAYDFKVDWWDPEYSLEEKRRTLKTSWQVHKILGTKAAVEKAASAVYPETRVTEWFEYGGEPYHFRMDVDLPEDGWTQERHKRLTWRLQYYKNLRSHLDSIIYRTHPIVLENRQALWFMVLRIRTWTSNFNPAPVRFNGRRLFDGSICFDNREIPGPAMESVKLTAEARNRNACSVYITSDGMWRLDGTCCLDGSRKLNAGGN